MNIPLFFIVLGIGYLIGLSLLIYGFVGAYLSGRELDKCIKKQEEALEKLR